jgi:hypothetical protein
MLCLETITVGRSESCRKIDMFACHFHECAILNMSFLLPANNEFVLPINFYKYELFYNGYIFSMQLMGGIYLSI